jgi:hypothetical protein
MTIRPLATYLSAFVPFLCAGAACAASTPPLAGGAQLRSQAGPYEVEVLVDGVPAPTFSHRGETYVLGQMGERYTLRVANRSARRIEAVVSVDGRDVMDGKPADFRSKRGYLVPAWETVEIDGWRLSQAEVAAFRFSSVANSYAARTGSAREVGVIGVAVFPERPVVIAPPPPRPRPLYAPPADGRAPRSSSSSDSLLEGGGSRKAEAQAESAPSSAARSRPGLGTEFGEAVTSHVHEVAFVRANAARPSTILGVRYNDRGGLVAMGVDVDRCGGGYWPCDPDSDPALRRTASPFPVVHRRYAAPPPGWQGGCCLR